MSSSIILDLDFTADFACDDSGQRLPGRTPLFLATDGVHGVVTVDYRTNPPGSQSNDVVKLCLYGVQNPLR